MVHALVQVCFFMCVNKMMSELHLINFYFLEGDIVNVGFLVNAKPSVNNLKKKHEIVCNGK